jgi:hypothetical protein
MTWQTLPIIDKIVKMCCTKFRPCRPFNDSLHVPLLPSKNLHNDGRVWDFGKSGRMPVWLSVKPAILFSKTTVVNAVPMFKPDQSYQFLKVPLYEEYKT